MAARPSLQQINSTQIYKSISVIHKLIILAQIDKHDITSGNIFSIFLTCLRDIFISHQTLLRTRFFLF